MRAWGALVLMVTAAFVSTVGCGSSNSSNAAAGTRRRQRQRRRQDRRRGRRCLQGDVRLRERHEPLLLGGRPRRSVPQDLQHRERLPERLDLHRREEVLQVVRLAERLHARRALPVRQLDDGRHEGHEDVRRAGEIGDGCLATTDCDASKKLFCSQDDPGGQCLSICKTQSDCPAGSICTDEQKCYASCKTNADCTRDGYACVDAMTVDKKPTKTCDVAGG